MAEKPLYSDKEMAHLIVDILTLHDIQEDEAQSEQEENPDACRNFSLAVSRF